MSREKWRFSYISWRHISVIKSPVIGLFIKQFTEIDNKENDKPAPNVPLWAEPRIDNTGFRSQRVSKYAESVSIAWRQYIYCLRWG